MSLPHLLHYHFMQNAYLAGTFVAIAAGAIGYFVVLRGQSFAGHSFANVGFAGATGAALIGAPPVVGLLGGGMLAAAGMHWLGLGVRDTARSDSAIGAILSASLALGYLFLYLSHVAYGAAIYDVLFGNVLGVSDYGVLASAVLTTALLLCLVISGRPLLFASVDPTVAEGKGVPVRGLSLLFLTLLAVMVAAAVQVVGVLLIFSLLVTPAATSRYLSNKPAAAMAMSMGIAVLSTWAGLAAGYYTPWPISFYIASFGFAAYVAARAWRALSGRRNGAGRANPSA